MNPTMPDPATEPVVPRSTVPATNVREDDESKGPLEVTSADLQQLRFGPIFAGLMTAVGIFVLLTLPAIALGLQAAPGAEDLADMGVVAIIVTSLIALVSFFVGGFVSTWSAGVSDPGRSLINGFLVWSLWLVAVALLATFGIGSIVGAAGNLFGQISAPAADVDTQQLIDTIRSGSWQSFLALVLTALAAALGGVVGAREDLRGAWMRTSSTRLARR